ncbi:MAG: nucleotidyl transferase AbiEii/AbiGii toxin family protein [Mycoplasmataceae bacterium]|jgi:predicted nucleotidyltransferase component of viral defense system|nr:nucleotidyl transferase AbiEii/AbiGii toxin family protein [Mycoplasmataceae bacterium]
MKYSNQQAHSKIIDEFLTYLNKQSSYFVLKGGTALCKFYKNPRFSEDIDLDSPKGNLSNIVKNFCLTFRYSAPVEKKDTTNGQRFMIDYGIKDQKLKIETSHRFQTIDPKQVKVIDGVRVYTISSLAVSKLHAYIDRDKIRDLYDLTFIINNYWHELNEIIRSSIIDGFREKDLANQYDIVVQQDDPLINKKELEHNVLIALEKIGLIKN